MLGIPPIDDIEDFDAGLILPPVARVSSGLVSRRIDPQAQVQGQTTSVFVKTWGCGHNNSDGEYMAGLLHEAGYTVLLDHSAAQDADVWVLNSCTVKGPSESTFDNDIAKGLEAGKKVVLAGCVPQGAKSSPKYKNLSGMYFHSLTHSNLSFIYS